MSRRSQTRVVRSCVAAGILCLAAAGLAIVASQVPVRADDAPGSGFGALGLTARASGQQLTYDYTVAQTHPIVEGETALSVAQLQAGPRGYGLSSITWPGTLAANGGSVAVLLGLPLSPEQANGLNYPVRAEARTGAGPSTVTNTQVPGMTMTATATDTTVRAATTMLGSSGPAAASSAGTTRTTSITTLTGPSTATATATSTIEDINLGGVVSIGAVKSQATGTTNGVRASAKGGIVVGDMKIGGQPAYVDEQGLHIGTVGAPVNAVANAIASQALKAAGMQIAVSQPTKTVDKGRVTYDAGSLVFFWVPPGDTSGNTFTYAFGGASVSLAASPGFGSGTTDAIPLVTTPPAVGSPSAPPPGATAPGVVPALPLPTDPSAPGRPARAISPVVAPALRPIRLAKGLAPAWPVLVVVGSLLIGYALTRLPERVLEQSSTTCTLGGQL